MLRYNLMSQNKEVFVQNKQNGHLYNYISLYGEMDSCFVKVKY